MENVEGKSSNTHADMKKEFSHNLVLPAAATRCEVDDDELQYLDQAGKMLTNAKKKSFFQITSVTEQVNDENDSMDELDESRADDLSSADLSNSKLSLQTDIEQSDADDPSNSTGVCLNPNYAASNPNAEANGNGPSRFKLVKVARIEPIKRGRWTCKDFLTEMQPGAESSAPKTEQMKDNVSGSSSAASSVHYVPGENPLTDNPLGEANCAPQQPPPPSSEKTSKDAKSSSISKKGFSSALGHVGSDRNGSKSTSSKDPLNKKELSYLPSLMDSLSVDTDKQSESDESTSATGGAIDNKIEQAMDLVKSHLLFAVREEVEVLKEQIQELVEKNEQLQRENSLLRQHQPQGIPHLPYSQAETPKATMHVSTTAGTQDQTGFPGMPGGAPRTDGFAQQQPNPTEQFGGMQAAGGPTHGQAPTQQQTLPQQQAGQYVHIQPQPPLSQPLQVQPLQTQPLQTPHSIPQQTTTQHAKPPSQT